MSLKKFYEKFKDLGLLKTLKKILVFAEEKPALVGQLLREIDVLIESKTNEALPPSNELLQKNQFIAIVGRIKPTIKNTIQKDFLENHGIGRDKIQFFDNNEHLKNGRYCEKLKSSNCVGIIWGAIPHSINEDLHYKLETKSIDALNGHNNLELTRKTIQKSIVLLFEKNA